MSLEPVALVWENLGPPHHDRLRAVHDAGHRLVAVQLFRKSAIYDWERDDAPPYQVVTLADALESVGFVRLAWRIFRAVRKSGARDVYMCHYEMPAVILASWMLKLSGCRVYTMLNSKFDDRPRHWRMTPAKALAFAAYRGAIIASERSRDYAAYFGIPRARTVGGYNTLDIARLRAQSGAGEAVSFGDRPFLAVAQLIPRKNLKFALTVFARYRHEHGGTRRFVIVGKGVQEPELREHVASLGVSDAVEFAGAMPSAGVTALMRRSLALLLPSLEETYGYVVLEAMAMGLPAIVSLRAGAADLVSNLVNGFLIDPTEEEQLLTAMLMLDRDEALHATMAKAALETSDRGDARHFAAGVGQLLELNGKSSG